MKSYRCPGRMNLMGDHIDYHEGLVLPMAIEQGIRAIAKPEEDIVLQSDRHTDVFTFSIHDTFSFDAAKGWINYPLGVIDRFRKLYGLPRGFSLQYSADLPEGAGLSSSAAIEVITWYALCDFFAVPFQPYEAIQECRKTENEFIGVPCGVMDQAAVTLSREDHALLLNCSSLEHQHIPLHSGRMHWVIMNTCKPRSLIHSRYALRKQESDEAFRQIQGVYPERKSLSECTIGDLTLLKDTVLLQRARHVITEQWRVLESARVLHLGDLQTFGRLMCASHRSLCNDYEVSGAELDALTGAAEEQAGCLGTRMTGAGMGGCAIALVKEENYTAFLDNVSKQYELEIGYPPAIWTTRASSGVRAI